MSSYILANSCPYLPHYLCTRSCEIITRSREIITRFREIITRSLEIIKRSCRMITIYPVLVTSVHLLIYVDFFLLFHTASRWTDILTLKV